MFDHPIEVVHTKALPPERRSAASLGRHLDGCRIGFDLGGSDRKVAAVIDGKVVFSEETVWDPYFQPDPQYHYDGIMDSLKKAAAHLPRVDAIGGSAAGVYVNNRVKVASLFRGVPPDVFNKRVRDLFLEIRKAWNNIPLEVVNDGEVTALAGSMSLGKNRILGISLGTSTAGGYVNAEGNITSWINELAFVPVDYNPQARHRRMVRRLRLRRAVLLAAMRRAPARAGGHRGGRRSCRCPRSSSRCRSSWTRAITAPARSTRPSAPTSATPSRHFTDFYDLENVLILGRVTSGPGGDIIIAGAKEVLKVEFPELTGKIAFHIPDEKDKRHGQAVAAASLPKLA